MTTDTKDFDKPIEPEPLEESSSDSSSSTPSIDLQFSEEAPVAPLDLGGEPSISLSDSQSGTRSSSASDFPDSPFPESPELELSQTQGPPPFNPQPFNSPSEALSTASAPATSATPTPGTLDLLREFAEQTPVGKPVVQAEFPFSLSIEGRLTAEEKEKLVDLIKRENMGIMESDLEPQLAAGRILIPRISEYAGVLLVQAMRSVNAEVKLGPSDSIFSTEDTRTAVGHPELLNAGRSDVFVAESMDAADRIVVTNLPFLPEFPHFTVVETLTASGALSSSSVEAETSPEYQEMMEALQKELRHKAFHKGAVAVINFQTSLVQLGAPTTYRLSVTGSAIRGAPKPVI